MGGAPIEARRHPRYSNEQLAEKDPRRAAALIAGASRSLNAARRAAGQEVALVRPPRPDRRTRGQAAPVPAPAPPVVSPVPAPPSFDSSLSPRALRLADEAREATARSMVGENNADAHRDAGNAHVMAQMAMTRVAEASAPGAIRDRAIEYAERHRQDAAQHRNTETRLRLAGAKRVRLCPAIDSLPGHQQ